jgi:hypothetical protein
VSNWGYDYYNGFVLCEGLDIFILGAIATGGNMNRSGILSLQKRTLMGFIGS